MSLQTSEYEAVTANGAAPPDASGLVQSSSAPVAPGPSAPILFIPKVESGFAPRRRPRSKAWLPLATEGDYTDFHVYVWLRYPDELNSDIVSGDSDKRNEALRKLVIDHNGWPDPVNEDRPLPSAGTACPGKTAHNELACCFWHHISGDEYILIMRAIAAERGKALGLSLDGKKP